MPDGMTLPEHVGLHSAQHCLWCVSTNPSGTDPIRLSHFQGPPCVLTDFTMLLCYSRQTRAVSTLLMNRCDFNGTDGRFYSHGGDVFTGEGIGGVTDQQTGLTHSPEEDGRGRTADDKFNKKNGFVFKIHLKVCLCGFYVSGLGWVLPCTLTVPHRHWPTFMLPEGHRSPL